MSDENGKTKRVPNPQGYLGQACRAGYQSHYTVVDSRNILTAFPFKEEKIDPAITSNEIVIFDGAQILPLFLIYTNEFTSGETTSQDITQGFHFLLFFHKNKNIANNNKNNKRSFWWAAFSTFTKSSWTDRAWWKRRRREYQWKVGKIRGRKQETQGRKQEKRWRKQKFARRNYKTERFVEKQKIISIWKEKRVK